MFINKDTSKYKDWNNRNFTVGIGYTKDEMLFADTSLFMYRPKSDPEKIE